MAEKETHLVEIFLNELLVGGVEDFGYSSYELVLEAALSRTTQYQQQ